MTQFEHVVPEFRLGETHKLGCTITHLNEIMMNWRHSWFGP